MASLNKQHKEHRSSFLALAQEKVLNIRLPYQFCLYANDPSFRGDKKAPTSLAFNVEVEL